MASAIDPSTLGDEPAWPATLKPAESPSPVKPNPARPSPIKPAGPERFEIERPKEHGAYAMLGVPLVAAFCIAGFTWIGLTVALASVLGFIAHEPLMIATGRRGPRALREAPTAHLRVIALLCAAALLGTPALLFGSLAVRLALVACLPLAAVSFVLSARGKQRSLVAQLWSSLALVLPSLIVLLAASMEPERALQLSAAWALGQSGALIAVRSVIARHKKANQGRVPLINDLLQIALTFTAVVGLFGGLTAFLSISPMIVVAGYLRLFSPSPKHLRQLGWALVASHVASALWMIAAQSPFFR